MVKNDLKKDIIKLQKRIERIEKIIKIRPPKPKQHEGVAGGINFLIENKFFKKPVLVTEVHEELKKEGYYYSLQAVDTSLRRDFVKRKKILNRIQVDGLWQYTLRK